MTTVIFMSILRLNCNRLRMRVDNYCVLYIPDAEEAVVTIIRVMYGGRDIDTQLKRYTRQ